MSQDGWFTNYFPLITPKDDGKWLDCFIVSAEM